MHLQKLKMFLVVDSNGNKYVAKSAVGDDPDNLNHIFKINKYGTATLFHTSSDEIFRIARR